MNPEGSQAEPQAYHNDNLREHPGMVLIIVRILQWTSLSPSLTPHPVPYNRNSELVLIALEG